MAKASIYVVNTNEVNAGTDSALPLGDVVKRPCNRNLLLSGSTINVSDCYRGYYKVTVCATCTAPSTGVDVIGGTTKTTISTADTVTRSMSFTSLIRASCGCIVDQLQVINTGIPATFSNIAVTVDKE